jgi:hypothetical protein
MTPSCAKRVAGNSLEKLRHAAETGEPLIWAPIDEMGNDAGPPEAVYPLPVGSRPN